MFFLPVPVISDQTDFSRRFEFTQWWRTLVVLHLLWSAGKSWTVTPSFRSAHMHTQEKGCDRCASSLESTTPYSLMHMYCHLCSQTCQQQASAHTRLHTHSPQGMAVCGSRGHLGSCCCCCWSVVLPASPVIRLMGASHALKVWIFTDGREGGKGTGQGEWREGETKFTWSMPRS